MRTVLLELRLPSEKSAEDGVQSVAVKPAKDISVTIVKDDDASSLALAESEKAWPLLLEGKTIDMALSESRALEAKIRFWQMKTVGGRNV